MPDLPPRESRLRQLVLRGIMPSVAERIVAECEAVDQRLLSEDEAVALAEVTAADMEAARTWWWWAPDVPVSWKRLLDAQVVGEETAQR